MGVATWKHFPHVADVGIRGYGATPSEAFVEAALAMTAVVTDPDNVRPLQAVEIECAAPDLETLFVDWPNRLVFEMATRPTPIPANDCAVFNSESSVILISGFICRDPGLSPATNLLRIMPLASWRPGLAFVAIGRNPGIAWGGTNLHAASSDFNDVSNLASDAIIARRNGSASAPGSMHRLHLAHRFSTGRHQVTYGSSARHISDLSDLNSNYFVLLGGQDGWLGSDTFGDQLALWHRYETVQVPLRSSTARARSSHRIELEAAHHRSRRA